MAGIGFGNLLSLNLCNLRNLWIILLDPVATAPGSDTNKIE